MKNERPSETNVENQLKRKKEQNSYHFSKIQRNTWTNYTKRKGNKVNDKNKNKKWQGKIRVTLDYDQNVKYENGLNTRCMYYL